MDMCRRGLGGGSSKSTSLSGVRPEPVHILPGMKERKLGGGSFSISSEKRYQYSRRNDCITGMSKTAQLAGWSRGLAQHCAGTGDNCELHSSSGPPTLPAWEEFVKQTRRRPIVRDLRGGIFLRAFRPSSLAQAPLRTPDEVARLVTFVCSPVASAINRPPALRVDGGVVSSCF